LDGDWRFHWVRRPADRPRDFFEPRYDASDWDTIPVPSNWEIHGYGVPIYHPAGLPKSMRKKNIPDIDPDYNPVGSYRRNFELPQEWAEREIFVRFGGVRSAFYVWVNGHPVGYSQGSRLPAEFRITPARTFWRSRFTAGRMAPTWKTRTCGSCRASFARSSCWLYPRYTSVTFP